MSVSYCSLLARNFFVEKERKKRKLLTHVQLFATPWTVAHQASSSLRFSRKEYWSGLPFPSPRNLPDPGIKPRSFAFQKDSLPSEPPGRGLFLSYFNFLDAILKGIAFYIPFLVIHCQCKEMQPISVNVNLAKFISFSRFCVESLEFSIYSTMLSTYNDNLTTSLPI